MTNLASQSIKKVESSALLRRIVEKDKAAIKDCIDAYGNFIWGLARKLTTSRQKAEAATEEIFIDIWRHCEHSSSNQLSEKKRIAEIALRRLIKTSSVGQTNYYGKRDRTE